ncbi:proteasome adapter and scaffold protein ECM29-like [Ornithodoros turicata]|uniref:proteasome adapter and scaffold protein ECM29-like n=1 Tax=Ornithodoros turicata TaxID=34597 RepID=UPI0031392C65
MAEAQDELVLVERVFLRIAAADTDEQLQNALARFLPPVLLKLSSPQDGVRKKVMELLVHVNKRLKTRPQVQLPMDALLVQYEDPAATSFVINFAVIYIKMGYPRLEVSRRVELLPVLLNCIRGKPQQHQDSLLLMALLTLPHVKIPQDPEQCVHLLGLSDKPQAAKMLSEIILDLLFLPYGMTLQTALAKPAQVTPEGGAASDAPRQAPAGLSELAVKRLLGETQFSPEELEKTKLGAVRFVASGVYPVSSILPHLLVASADTRHSVASAAEMELKRVNGSVDWNDSQLISRLFNIYLGTLVPKDEKSTVRPEHRRSPANTRIRLKFFPYFLKSRQAATQFPGAMLVTFGTIYGQTDTNPKLKSMGLQFVHMMCHHNTQEQMKAVAKVLIQGMVRITQDEEEPDAKLRALAYVAIGKLGSRVPQLVTGDLSYLYRLYEGLTKEHGDARLAVQEALSLVAPAFTNVDEATGNLLVSLIGSSIESIDPMARQTAVHYAATVFQPTHIPSKFLLLLAAGDAKEDIRREAVKALHPQQMEGAKAADIYPSFPAVMEYVSEKATSRMSSNTTAYVKGGVRLPFNPPQFIEVLRYLRCCLCTSAGIPTLDVRDTGSLQDQSPLVSAYIRKLTEESSPAPRLYCSMLERFLPCLSDASALYALLELAALIPNEVAPGLTGRMNTVKNLLASSKEDLREHAAQLYALILTYTSDDTTFLRSVEGLRTDAGLKNPELQQGSILALGYALGRKLYTNNSSLGDPKMREAVTGACSLFVRHLKDTQGALMPASCTALGEVSRHGALPLPPGARDNDNDKGSSESEVTKMAVVTAVANILKNNKLPAKSREKAAQTLGYLCLGDKGFPHTRAVLDVLLGITFEAADVEVHFTVGEAICSALLGPASPQARDFWTVSEKDFVAPSDYSPPMEPMDWLVNEILEKFVRNPKPAVRQAACIWILSLLKRCSRYGPVLSRLKLIQTSLLNLLADRSDLTQSIASKGLSLLYEMSNEEDRKELVSLLLETLTTGRKANITVTEDTRLFDEGTLGSTPTGGGLTTYKELCSLATDLNQPDLMYKFMHLANHHAMWNSKKGAAFGFGSIAEKAGEQLSEHLGEIVPKLYRYQYDPNPGIRASFTSIWGALVKEPQKTVDKYLREILQDLIQNLTSNEWRVRESSCLALSDLLRGRRLNDILQFLPTLWETLFRVRDDIKESVRNAADGALKTLSKACVKLCDVSSGKSGEQAVAVILPCLVQTGLTNQVSEVREISLSTVVKISKSAGLLLRPHLPLLFVALLDALSELEPQVFSYLSVRTSAENKDKLDAARVAACRSSPMMETINHCVQYVDEGVLQDLVPRLVDQMKSSIGLGTKAGCSHLVISLTHQAPIQLQPHVGKLLGAFVHGLNDKNATVRKSYATAIGNLTKVAKPSSVEKLMGKMQTWYMEKDDDTVRWAVAHTMQAVARYAPDVVRDHAAVILPLSFFAMHATVLEPGAESPAALWEDIWNEFTIGYESGLKLYLAEVVALIQQGLDSGSWGIKRQAGETACKLGAKLGPALGTTPHMRPLLDALLASLSGRTWTGKESILKAISAICKECISCTVVAEQGEDANARRAFLDKIAEALLRECRKENPVYREEAIQAIAPVLEKHKLDYFAPLLEILEPLLRKATGRNQAGEEISDDEDDSKKGLESKLQFQSVCYEALGQAWPLTPDTQAKYQARFCDLLVCNFSASTWKVQLSILKSLRNFVTRLDCLQAGCKERKSDHLASISAGIVTVSCHALEMTKYATLRTEALELIKAFLSRLKKSKQTGVLSSASSSKLRTSVEMATSDGNVAVKDLAQELLTDVLVN